MDWHCIECDQRLERKRDRLRHAVSASIILMEEYITPETAKAIDELVEQVVKHA